MNKSTSEFVTKQKKRKQNLMNKKQTIFELIFTGDESHPKKKQNKQHGRQFRSNKKRTRHFTRREYFK